jgi:DNA-binding transcriptional ArsR family regulator
MASLLQALGPPRRREILRLVWDGERSAGEIHRALGDVTFGAVSQHLRRLEEAALLRSRREGRHRFYAARKDGLGPLARGSNRCGTTRFIG